MPGTEYTGHMYPVVHDVNVLFPMVCKRASALFVLLSMMLLIVLKDGDPFSIHICLQSPTLSARRLSMFFCARISFRCFVACIGLLKKTEGVLVVVC